MLSYAVFKYNSFEFFTEMVTFLNPNDINLSQYLQVVISLMDVLCLERQNINEGNEKRNSGCYENVWCIL